jgi:hypothetical protein
MTNMTTASRQHSPVPNEVRLSVAGQISEGQALDAAGHEVRVTVLQGGTSKNGYTYNEEALQSIARLVEGAHAYADHASTSADSLTRSVRDVVGFYHDACYVPSLVGAPARVEATLHILEAASWLWSMICEACSLGRPNLIGLSIDILGQWQRNEASNVKEITCVIALNSCDVVTRPSAGGTFQHILHSEQQGAHTLMEIPLQHTPQHIDSSREGSHAAQTAPVASEQAEAPTAAVAAQITEQQAQLNTLMHDLQLERSQLTLERRLMESLLPDPVRALVRQRFTDRIVEAGEIEAEISAQTDMLAALAAQDMIRGHSYEKPAVGQMITEAEKVQAAFDRMFDLEIDTARLGNVRGFSGIREAYARVTGDGAVGSFSDRSLLGNIRVSEHAPIGRISEADTTTASFSYLLGTSMNKRLLKDYQAWPAEWMKFCTIVPIRDFKQQSRVRLGAFNSLSIVAEDTAYSTITLSDSAATYVPQKRGNLVTVSRETIVNDDLQAIKQIPTKLAVAAAYTLAEFVYSFLSSNPTIYDGSALFTSGAPHNNLGSSNLSTSAMQTGVTAMREQTNYAGKRIGLRPRFLVVPAELEWTAMVVTKSAGVPGSNNNDINPMLGYVTPIVAPQLTNTTQWFFVCDPREVDTIELGFVGGQLNPALFIQDQPLFGLNFTQDVISYKIRHEYGGAVVDYRGLYRGI